MSALNEQVGGDHYKNMAIQPVDYIFKNQMGFLEGSVIKYVSRHKNKNGVEDLQKARHFLDLLIEFTMRDSALSRSTDTGHFPAPSYAEAVVPEKPPTSRMVEHIVDMLAYELSVLPALQNVFAVVIVQQPHSMAGKVLLLAFDSDELEGILTFLEQNGGLTRGFLSVLFHTDSPEQAYNGRSVATEHPTLCGLYANLLPRPDSLKERSYLKGEWLLAFVEYMHGLGVHNVVFGMTHPPYNAAEMGLRPAVALQDAKSAMYFSVTRPEPAREVSDGK